jgi:hypothetical protein
MGKVVWTLFLEEGDKIEWIWIDLSARLLSDFQESSRPFESLSLDLEALDRKV